MNARVDQPGANGAVDQSNAAAASADAGATNDAGPADAGASAIAAQANPTNVNVSARVNSAGDDGAVTQSNTAAAGADAAATGQEGSQASADAGAAQDAPVNVNVSVRVNSPGTQGDVSQQNTATATAGDTPSAPQASVPAGDRNSASVDNDATLGQQLDQCPAQCSESPAAAPVSSDTPAPAPVATTATATQQSPTNLNVSVRVASPGEAGAVGQSSSANADADAATAISSNPTNVDVQVEIAGTDPVTAPESGEPWTWVWNWDLGAAPTGAATTGNAWNWDWTTPASPPTAATETTAPTDGHWIWILNWTTPDGTEVSVTVDQPCTCAWVWSWSWVGAPAAAPSATSSQPQAAPAAAQVEQTNTASASAAASVSANVEQQANQQPADGGTQTNEQTVDFVQSASATSSVTQTAPSNWSVVTAGELSSLTQWNLVSASSSAQSSLRTKQLVSQVLQLATGDTAAHTQDATQQITILQSADASARTLQTEAHNRNRIASARHTKTPLGAIRQRNIAVSAAVAGSSTSVSQTITQHEVAEDADQREAALQETAIVQQAHAAVEVAQADLGNTDDVLIPPGGTFNPPLLQTNRAAASAQMTNRASVEQEISQSENGAFINWDMDASQDATILQSGDASASAEQAGIENLAGWRGQVAGSPAAAGRAEGQAAPATTLEAPVRAAEAATDDAITPKGGTSLVATTAVASPVKAGRLTPAWPQGRSRAPAARAVAAAGTTRAAQGRIVAGSCAPFCQTGYGSGLDGGPAAGLTGAWFALQPRAFKLAAPGVGRLLDDAPALGRPVDTSPFERPG